jgi:methionyl-tRNA formyltransferase
LQYDTRIDHGDILFERRFAIPDHCWVSDLYALAEQEAYTLFVNSLPALISGNYTKVSQQTLLQQRGSTIHYRHEINELKRLDLNESEDTLARTIRATYMPGFEPPYFLINGRKVYVSLEDAQ